MAKTHEKRTVCQDKNNFHKEKQPTKIEKSKKKHMETKRVERYQVSG